MITPGPRDVSISRSIRMALFCRALRHGKSRVLHLIISARSPWHGSGKNPRVSTGFAAPNGCRNHVDFVRRERSTLAAAAVRQRSSQAIQSTRIRHANFHAIIGKCERQSSAAPMSPIFGIAFQDNTLNNAEKSCARIRFRPLSRSVVRLDEPTASLDP